MIGGSGSLSFSILASSSGSSGRRYWASQESASAELSPSEVVEITSEITSEKAGEDTAVRVTSASPTLSRRVPPGKRSSALYRRLWQEHLENDPVRPAHLTCKISMDPTVLQNETPALSVISRPRARSLPPRDGVGELKGGADLAAWTASSSVRHVEAHVATPSWVDRRTGRRGAGEHDAKS